MSCRPTVKARVSVEQASTFGWTKYVGDHGTSIGMRTFGASAPLKDLLVEFGFTVDRVAEAARGQLKGGSSSRSEKGCPVHFRGNLDDFLR